MSVEAAPPKPVEVGEGELVDYEEEEEALPTPVTKNLPHSANGKEGTKKYATTS